MHIWRGLLQQSQAGEDEREEEDEEGGKDAIGAPAKADLLLLRMVMHARHWLLSVQIALQLLTVVAR